jgi:imidazole glycerol-phosphate synthase subunit HisF
MNYKKPFFFGADSITFSKAKRLRKPLTRAETVLWKELRNRQLDGFKFRRQHPAGPYIADFFCMEAMLVVEVDGAVHDSPEAQETDEKRTRFFTDNGVKVIRFRNKDVIRKLPAVLKELKKILSSRTSQSPTVPSPLGEGQGEGKDVDV